MIQVDIYIHVHSARNRLVENIIYITEPREFKTGTTIQGAPLSILPEHT